MCNALHVNVRRQNGYLFAFYSIRPTNRNGLDLHATALFVCGFSYCGVVGQTVQEVQNGINCMPFVVRAFFFLSFLYFVCMASQIGPVTICFH